MKRTARAAAPKRSASPVKAATKKGKPAEKKKDDVKNPTVTPSLVIPGGKGSEALAFYANAFGAKEKARMSTPEGKIMHSEFQIGDSKLYLYDEWSPATHPPTGISLHLHVADADATFETAVAAGCKVTMPLADQFWGDRFGKVTDPYGHSWSIAHTTEVLSFKEAQERGTKWAADMAAQGDKKETASSPSKKEKVTSPTKAAAPKVKLSRKK